MSTPALAVLSEAAADLPRFITKIKCIQIPQHVALFIVHVEQAAVQVLLRHFLQGIVRDFRRVDEPELNLATTFLDRDMLDPRGVTLHQLNRRVCRALHSGHARWNSWDMEGFLDETRGWMGRHFPPGRGGLFWSHRLRLSLR
jgi:hypothetical protein